MLAVAVSTSLMTCSIAVYAFVSIRDAIVVLSNGSESFVRFEPCAECVAEAIGRWKVEGDVS